MIKNLIWDLIHKKISLSDALTRAKFISVETNNDTFTNWLKNELGGYKYDDQDLPTYRKIFSPLYLVAMIQGIQKMTFQIFIPNHLSKEEKKILEIHQSVEPITAIEKYIDDLDSTARINLPAELYETLYQFLTDLEKNKIKIFGASLTKGYREISKLQLNNILEMTKQKLIDTLTDLNKQFPNFMDDFKPSKEDNEKLQTIVTNNIYGGTNPMNLAVGENITQSDNIFNITIDQKEQLKTFGIEEEQIDELEVINNENSKGSKSRKTKISAWLGRATSSLVSRGIYDQIPKLTEFIVNIM